MSVLVLLPLVAAVVLGAIAQRTTGIGFALLVAPACALAFEPEAAIGTVVRLAIVADLLVLLGERSAVDWRSLRNYLMPAVLAFPLALATAAIVPSQSLVGVASVATVGAALAVARSRRHSASVVVLPSAAGTRAAGFAASFMGITTGMSGPPLALHASVSGRPMATGRATMTVFFLVIDVAALIAHPHGASSAVTAGLLAALGFGALTGGWAVGRLDEAHLRRAIPPLVLVSGCAALARVLS